MEKKKYTAPEISIHTMDNTCPLCSSFDISVDSTPIDMIGSDETGTDSKWSSTFDSSNWGDD